MWVKCSLWGPNQELDIWVTDSFSVETLSESEYLCNNNATNNDYRWWQ